LVTGASGLLGLEVIRCLSDSGFDVVGVYNSNPHLADKNYRNLKCDIGDLKSVNSLGKKIGRIDIIFHCASMTGIDKCEKNKEACWKANVIGTRNIIELAKKHKSKLIYISTGSVFFGEKSRGSKDEGNPGTFVISKDEACYKGLEILFSQKLNIQFPKYNPSNFEKLTSSYFQNQSPYTYSELKIGRDSYVQFYNYESGRLDRCTMLLSQIKNNTLMELNGQTVSVDGYAFKVSLLTIGDNMKRVMVVLRPESI